MPRTRPAPLRALNVAPPARRNGPHDPGVLKAVFLVGGPGAGKSRAARHIFGFGGPGGSQASYATGLKLVSSDLAFERMLNAAGIDPATLAHLPLHDFRRLTEGPDSMRARAKAQTARQRDRWIDARLGLVLDGTGADYAVTHEQVNLLRSLGYDTFLLVVNTPLDVALARNAARSRRLPDALVTSIWRAVQDNLGRFQHLFGPGNMVVLDAGRPGPVPRSVTAAVYAFLRAPVQNHLGRAWLRAHGVRA